jgi:hypothetical protein
VCMEEFDASINVSEETAVSIFRDRIKNVTPCSLPNYSTRVPEDRDLCKNMGEFACVATLTALLRLPQ